MIVDAIALNKTYVVRQLLVTFAINLKAVVFRENVENLQVLQVLRPNVVLFHLHDDFLWLSAVGPDDEHATTLAALIDDVLKECQ